MNGGRVTGNVLMVLKPEEAKLVHARLEEALALRESVADLSQRAFLLERAAWSTVKELVKAGGKTMPDDRNFTVEEDGRIVDTGPAADDFE